MGEGPLIAIIRGLKVHIRVLDKFFNNNGCHKTYGCPPSYDKEDPDEFSALLRSKLSSQDTTVRLLIPWRTAHGRSSFGYIAWAYEMVYAQREVLLDDTLPVSPPEGWDTLRDEILSFSTSKDAILEASGHGKTGLFVVVCDDRSYYPPSIEQRIPVYSFLSSVLLLLFWPVLLTFSY